MNRVGEAQIEVPASLAGWVAAITELRPAAGRGETVVRLPDAASSLVICEDAHGAVKIVAVGPLRCAFYKSSASLTSYTRIAFHPGKARLALGASPRELTNGTADLVALWGSSARPVLDAVARMRRSQSVVEVVAPLLSRRFAGASSITSEVVRRAARSLDVEQAEHPRVQAIAAHLRVSERFLRKAFREELGVSPKRYARIARIRRVAVAAATEATPWATLATTHGFFDQAHLNAEFRDLLRATPTAFRAGDVPGSSSCGAP